MTNAETRHATRSELLTVTTSLIAEFADAVPPSTVVRCVDQARERLLSAGVRAGLAAATETMARMLLRELRPAHAQA